MENYKPRVTRISRKRAGEVTLIQILPEDLQQEFEKYLDLKNARETAAEELVMDDQNPELHRKFFLLQRDEHWAAYTFWQNVRDRFNLWLEPMVVRDGYEVVRALPPGFHIQHGIKDVPHE